MKTFVSLVHNKIGKIDENKIYLGPFVMYPQHVPCSLVILCYKIVRHN
jgi:hypothetical protein